MNLNQVTLPATNLEASARFYRHMGFLQIVEAPHYARFECPEGDATLSLLLVDEVEQSTAAVYFESARLDDLVGELAAQGFKFDQWPTDQSYLWREAVLHDPAGNKIVLYWAGEARKNPPWRVEIRS